MKKTTLISLLYLLLFNNLLFCQIYTEGFNSFTVGDLGTQGGWAPLGPGTQIQVESSSPVSYPGYEGSDMGNYLAIPQSSVAWSYKYFPGQNITSDFNIWMSFIIKINLNSTNGSYLMSFRDIDNKNDGAMLYITQGSNSSYVKYGVCKLSQIAYSGDYPTSNSQLIVLKYAYHSAGTDTFFIWVNPTLSSTELNASNATAYDIANNDPNWKTSVSYLNLIPKASNVGCSIDGFRMANTYQQGPLPVKLQSFNTNIYANNINLNWITNEEVNNKGFEILRNGVSIGWIKGKGNSNSCQYYSFSDNGLQSGKYNYELKQIDYNGNYSIIGKQLDLLVGLPEKIIIEAHPNPFNPVTELRYTLNTKSNIKISLYDLNGREVKSYPVQTREAGYYKEQLDCSNLSSGIYFCRFEVDNFTKALKLILLK